MLKNIRTATLSIPASAIMGAPTVGTPAQADLEQNGQDANGNSRFKPNPEDYVYADFRALSAAIVRNGTLDFTKPGVLKAAAPLLKNQTVYRDHRVSVDNWAGTVMGTSWDSTGGPAGENGPPGINCNLRIDGVQAPACARGLLSDPPALHSVSVGVEFEWEKSHPKMTDREFWRNFGDEIDGSTVRLVVTKITKFNEISLVWQGADPNAKRLSADGTCYEGDDSMLKADLAKLLGLDPETGDEVLMAELNKKMANVSTFESIQAQLSEANTKVDALTTELNETKEQLTKNTPASEELVAQANLGKTYLNDQRAEAARLFKLVEGEKASEAILTMLGNAGLETAKAYIDLYAAKAEEKFGASCSKCGSTDLTRQKGQVEDPNPGTNTAEPIPGSLSAIHG